MEESKKVFDVRKVEDMLAPLDSVRPEFQVHMLNDAGQQRARAMAEDFTWLLNRVEKFGVTGRELALVCTKLQEACFFAKRGMAMRIENRESVLLRSVKLPSGDKNTIAVRIGPVQGIEISNTLGKEYDLCATVPENFDVLKHMCYLNLAVEEYMAWQKSDKAGEPRPEPVKLPDPDLCIVSGPRAIDPQVKS